MSGIKSIQKEQRRTGLVMSACYMCIYGLLCVDLDQGNMGF